MCCEKCLGRDVVWWWFYSSGVAYDSVWDSVRPMTGKYLLQLFPVPRFRWVCMHAELLVQSATYDICPDNYNFSRFKLKDKCRSEKWEVYLYADMSIGCACTGAVLGLCNMPVVVTGHGVQTCKNCGDLCSCSSWCDGKACRAVYTGTRAGFPPPSGRGRGGGDSGSLLSGVLPPN